MAGSLGWSSSGIASEQQACRPEGVQDISSSRTLGQKSGVLLHLMPDSSYACSTAVWLNHALT